MNLRPDSCSVLNKSVINRVISTQYVSILVNLKDTLKEKQSYPFRQARSHKVTSIGQRLSRNGLTRGSILKFTEKNILSRKAKIKIFWKNILHMHYIIAVVV